MWILGRKTLTNGKDIILIEKIDKVYDYEGILERPERYDIFYNDIFLSSFSSYENAYKQLEKLFNQLSILDNTIAFKMDREVFNGD